MSDLKHTKGKYFYFRSVRETPVNILRVATFTHHISYTRNTADTSHTNYDYTSVGCDYFLWETEQVYIGIGC